MPIGRALWLSVVSNLSGQDGQDLGKCLQMEASFISAKRLKNKTWNGLYRIVCLD